MDHRADVLARLVLAAAVVVEPPVPEARAELVEVDRAAIKATPELADVADNRADVVPTVKAPVDQVVPVPVAQDADPAAVDRVVLAEVVPVEAGPVVRVAPIQKGCSLMRWSSMRTRTASSARKNSESSSKTFTGNNRADPVVKADPAVLVVVVPVKVVPVKVVLARAVPVETPRAMVPAARTVAPMKVANGPNGRGVPNEL